MDLNEWILNYYCRIYKPNSVGGNKNGMNINDNALHLEWLLLKFLHLVHSIFESSKIIQ